MKKVLALFFLSLIILSCSDDKSTSPPVMNIDKFPSQPGTSYTFNVTFGLTNPIIGTKRSYFIQKSNNPLSNTLSIYSPQVDSITYSGSLLVDTTYFRKTSSGVFYYIDTTGLAQLIPDSLRTLLKIDTETRALFFPLSINQTWPVYQIDIQISGVPIFSPIKAFAKVSDFYKMDFVTRNSTITSNVYRIDYTLEIQLSPEGQIERQTASALFAVGIGFIKWDGQAAVINLVRGTTFEFPSEIILEEMRSYFIP